MQVSLTAATRQKQNRVTGDCLHIRGDLKEKECISHSEKRKKIRSNNNKKGFQAFHRTHL